MTETNKWVLPIWAVGIAVVLAGGAGYGVAGMTMEPEVITKTKTLPAPPAEIRIEEKTPESCLDAIDTSLLIISGLNDTVGHTEDAINSLGGYPQDRSSAVESIAEAERIFSESADYLDPMALSVEDCRSSS